MHSMFGSDGCHGIKKSRSSMDTYTRCLFLRMVREITFFRLCLCSCLQRNFHGGCILYAQIVWDNSEIYPWMQQSCDFVLYSNLAINIFYGTLMGLFMLAAVWPRTKSTQFQKVGYVVSVFSTHVTIYRQWL